ncbi:phosphatidate cytidylyltransferase [Plasmodium falciparum NF54]|uniref:dolichol kinase n=2 Tax=Plasmodium falciparum TaxID=5833 RepID=B9ZSI8_PLAF7|nr:phosphatidate cytidylyltransferase, putative [Plasmodium falciparum 3D7]KAF4328305.1 phosphatidate cytidylyltransferase [Plasmodium falciparum NF54]PKC48073.1 phosphatidate cytidylyltransferase [Plasmodium falciparum NF54]CAX51192.2 phosphatidate cytidylyltransferase, putative [Plasmodium falciparum 3D7]|eukprot:XP_002808610.2 phosphatidate cytidylyltransferase, putative [Plasmodium falciparum 3D7]
MINILVILIITITQVKKKIFLCSCFTYIWILLTVLCNILIVSYMYHEKNKKKTKKEKNIEKEEKKYKNKNIYTILHPFIKIGKYYENEKETIMFDKNKRNFFSLYQNNKISIVKLFGYIYINNIIPYLFVPFFSTILIHNYDILEYDVSKLSVVFINIFSLSSVLLRYIKIHFLRYIICMLFFFLFAINLFHISEKVVHIFFLSFVLNFAFYHILFISVFQFTNKVFSFLEGLTVCIICSVLLNCSFYCLYFRNLHKQIIPHVLMIFISKLFLSLFIYGGICCFCCLSNDIEKKEKKEKKYIYIIFISSILFFLYNLYNLFSYQYDSINKDAINTLYVLINILISKKNYLLIFAWIIITISYLIYINSLIKKKKKLPYVRKHYHFLLFTNVYLAFITNKVDVLIIFLSFCFFLFIFVELIRKICEHFLPSCKVIKRFISRFIDERDNKGLVVTHIYLLTGVYIPILIDIIFNKSNYINRKNQSIYNFSKANFTLYTSALNTICIGDSMAAIGGMLYPWPKIKNTNNKSCAGSLFFFISTFISLLVFNYPFEPNFLVHINIFFIISIFGALFEAYIHDIDNLVLPIFTFCIYLSLEK